MVNRVKRPSFQFYPRDWLGDTALRTCSVAARGLWADMLSFMHEGEPYGYLRLNGKPVSPEALARMVGESPATVKRLLRELEEAGVPSVDDDGAFYSRRMVRDEHVRNARAEGGPKSLENPNVPQPKAGRKDWRKDTLSMSFGGSPASADADASADASKSGSADAAPLADAAAGTAPLPPHAEQLIAQMTAKKRADGRRQLLAALSPRGAPMPKGDRARAYDRAHLDWCCAQKLEGPPPAMGPGHWALFALYLVRDTYLDWKAAAEKREYADADPPGARNGSVPLAFGQELEHAREWSTEHPDVVAEVETLAAGSLRAWDQLIVERWRTAGSPEPVHGYRDAGGGP